MTVPWKWQSVEYRKTLQAGEEKKLGPQTRSWQTAEQLDDPHGSVRTRPALAGRPQVGRQVLLFEAERPQGSFLLLLGQMPTHFMT